MSEIKIHTSMEIAAPAGAAWQVFGEGFGDWASWSSGIRSSQLEGPLSQGVTRTNETTGLGTVRQELVVFAPASRTLAYEIRDGLPPFLRRVRNDWVIEPIGDVGCRLSGDAVFELAPDAAPMAPQIEGKMSGSLRTFAEEFRAHIERVGAEHDG